jgi:hypothetical protein
MALTGVPAITVVTAFGITWPQESLPLAIGRLKRKGPC